MGCGWGNFDFRRAPAPQNAELTLDRDTDTSVLSAPGDAVIGDGFPPVPATGEVVATGEFIVIRDRGYCAYFSAFALFTAAGMMWSSPPAIKSNGARSAV